MQPSRPYRAFTLIELTAVLAIFAILMTAAALSLKGPYEAARFENAMERLALLDRQIRDHARRFDRPAELGIDLATGTLVCLDVQEGESLMRPYRLGHGIAIHQAIVDDRSSDFGQTTVHFSSRGQSPTYALGLRNAGGATQWLVFLGATGQMIRSDHVNAPEELLHATVAERGDAR